jgi:hypothetical protein
VQARVTLAGHFSARPFQTESELGSRGRLRIGHHLKIGHLSANYVLPLHKLGTGITFYSTPKESLTHLSPLDLSSSMHTRIASPSFSSCADVSAAQAFSSSIERTTWRFVKAFYRSLQTSDRTNAQEFPILNLRL